MLEDPQRAVEVVVRVGEQQRLVGGEAVEEAGGQGQPAHRQPPGHTSGARQRGKRVDTREGCYHGHAVELLMAVGLMGALLGPAPAADDPRRGPGAPRRGPAPDPRRPDRPLRPDLPVRHARPRDRREGVPLPEAAGAHALGVPRAREEDVRLRRQDLLLLRARRPPGDRALAGRLPRDPGPPDVRAGRDPDPLRGDRGGRALRGRPPAAPRAAGARSRDRPRAARRRCVRAHPRDHGRSTRRATAASSRSTASRRTSASTTRCSGSRSRRGSRWSPDEGRRGPPRRGAGGVRDVVRLPRSARRPSAAGTTTRRCSSTPRRSRTTPTTRTTARASSARASARRRSTPAPAAGFSPAASTRRRWTSSSSPST